MFYFGPIALKKKVGQSGESVSPLSSDWLLRDVVEETSELSVLGER